MPLKIVKQDKSSDSIEERASIWVARHDSEMMSKGDAQLFAQWKNARPEHREEYEELERVWNEMGSVADLLGDDLHGQKPDPDILIKKFGVSTKTNYRYFLPTAIAASLLILMGTIWMSLSSKQSQDIYITSVGEIRTIALIDGSRVTLNTDTQLSVNFDRDTRQIDLMSGEAYFEVAKDPSRPFVVYAGRGEVKAVGTEFSVHRENEAVEVVVAEGVVEVAMISEEREPFENLDHNQITLRENQGAHYNGHLTEATSIDPDKLKRVLSWQKKKLEYDNEPLSEVVKDIERYTNKRIFIASSKLESLRIGGVYDTGDVDQLVDGLQDFFPVKAVKVTPYFTILVASDTGSETR